MSIGESGKLYLVGIGPGGLEHLTPAAQEALRKADSVVGYRPYVEQVEPLVQGKNLVATELGQELERAAKAVDLAYEGHQVAIVSSGDIGIYGMAGPVFRILVDRGWDGENPPLEVLPGISAMQAAAAILGSPLMQDFCTISLSDLLTPWETILRRLEGAAQGDFVVALYNPRSRKRNQQLQEARRILLDHRSGQTPVGIVRDAYRPGQGVILTDLEHLIDHVESVDMVTMVLIGNSTSFVHQGRMVTPRGYEVKQIP
jgi:precorrin-3B C17-methyltransferase